MNASRTAWIAGATGLVGSSLLEELASRGRYERIHLLSRRPVDVSRWSGKVVVRVVKDLSAITPQLVSDIGPVEDVYCALGTTIATAGSQKAFRKVDFEAVLKIAEAAKVLGARRMAVVSSVGADATSSNFYLRTKGEMEQALAKVGFECLIIARPSLLLGNRQEKRTGEQIATMLSKVFAPLMVGPMLKYRPIAAKTVASALVGAIEGCERSAGDASNRAEPLRVILHYEELMSAARQISSR